MRYNTGMRIFLPLAASCGLLFSGCSGTPIRHQPETLSLLVATDLHMLTPEYMGGSSFSSMLAKSDMKLSEYADVLTDALIEQAGKERPDALILTGDLTFNGEKKSHELLAEKLKQLTDQGIKVLVLPGNHDIDNPNAADWSGDKAVKAEAITPEEFRSIYQEDGYADALYTDPSSLSYVSSLSDTCWILMLDSCEYEKNTIMSYSGGRIREDTLNWLKPILEEAMKNGITVLSAMHHSLTDLVPSSDAYQIENAEEVQKLFARYQVHVNFCGHTHFQAYRSIEVSGTEETDLMTGSLDVYQHLYAEVRLTTGESLEYHARPLDVQAYAEAHHLTDPFFRDFDASSSKVFRTRIVQRMTDLFADTGLDEAAQKELLSLFAEEGEYLFAGKMGTFRSMFEGSEEEALVKSLPWKDQTMFLDNLKDYPDDMRDITISLNPQ